MFYDKFIYLCDKKGVAPIQVRKDLEISQSTMASWKSRGLTPNATTLAKLADYFGVTVDYLLGKDDNLSKPVLMQRNFDAIERILLKAAKIELTEEGKSSLTMEQQNELNKLFEEYNLLIDKLYTLSDDERKKTINTVVAFLELIRHSATSTPENK